MSGPQEQNHDYFSKPTTPSTPGQVHLGNVANRDSALAVQTY